MHTLQSRRRLSLARKEAIKRGLRRSWKDGAHAKRFHQKPADADTMRKRALWDRKGAQAGSFSAGGVEYAIMHSRRRTDAYDVKEGNRVVCSGGRVKVGLFLGALLA